MASTTSSSRMRPKPLLGKHVLPSLPYAYDALEPTITREIMEVHHVDDHGMYVKELNLCEMEYDEAVKSGDLSRAIGLQAAIRYNGGGHLNHSLFWLNMAPKSDGGGSLPTGDLLAHIEKTWGSFINFQNAFIAAAVGVHGSGWCWLGFNRSIGHLEIVTCANQDPLEATTGLIPLLGVDVWEHAYFVQYKSRRAEYLQNIWNVINFRVVNERYAAAKVMTHLAA